jgi:hypothetical protein
MAISIPAIVQTQLTALKNSIKPDYHSATTTYSSPRPPYVNVNRAAEILRMLTGLIDVTGLHVTGVHGATDVADAVATADATDPTTGYALSKAIKDAYNLHRVKTAGSVHGAADSANDVSSPDASTEGTLVTLCNEIKTKFNLHIVRIASSCHSVADSLDLVTTADCTAYASAYTLINAIKVLYNLHVVKIDGYSKQMVADIGAYTTVGSLQGAKVTFVGNITTDLTDVSAYVVTNTTGVLQLASTLPAIPVTGDHYAVEFSAIDSDLAVIEQGKGLGDGASNPYASGPSVINAIMKLIKQLGGTLPSYLDITTAQPFKIGSPHAGAGSLGEGGAILIADALQRVYDQVALYTVPA